MKIKILLVLIIAVFTGIIICINKEKANIEMQIVYFDTEPPKSFDPLEADRAINLPSTRMMYLTPIEVSVDNKLVSTILQDFKYLKESSTIEWIVNTNLKFENGTPITVDDVVMSVKRMALERPDFPVIKEIEGLRHWLQNSKPLFSKPSGIVINGNKISIKLKKDVSNPLFRFCLELFSIIPSNCIDLNSNKLICDKPPESGYYKLVNKSKDKIIFEKRFESNSHGIKLVEKIDFLFLTGTQIKENINLISENSILMGIDFGLYSQGLDYLKQSLEFKYLPASLFASIMLNPLVFPFNDIKCRQVFSLTMQEVLAELKNDNLTFSTSLFVPIIPGYVSEDQRPKIQLDQDCINKFKNAEISWAKVKSNRLTFFEEILAKTVEKLQLKEKIIEVENPSEIEPLFVNGKIAFRHLGSGFWALDPIGDLQMLFSPNLHPMLKFVSSDSYVRELLLKIENGTVDEQINLMKILNNYLYQDAKMNVFLHTRKFYASPKKGNLRELAQEVANPAPWQIFSTERL